MDRVAFEAGTPVLAEVVTALEVVAALEVLIGVLTAGVVELLVEGTLVKGTPVGRAFAGGRVTGALWRNSLD